MSTVPTIILTDVDSGAVMDVLLLIEASAGRLYPDRAHDADQSRGYNNLAAIVLPLRAAMDKAVAP